MSPLSLPQKQVQVQVRVSNNNRNYHVNHFCIVQDDDLVENDFCIVRDNDLVENDHEDNNNDNNINCGNANSIHITPYCSYRLILIEK